MTLRFLVTAGAGLALAFGTMAGPALAAKAGLAAHKTAHASHKAASITTAKPAAARK